MIVGAAVNNDTSIRVDGKAAALGEISVGNTVTLRYLKADDLYAKEITKK
jgi:hypothetical protein